MSNKIWTTVVIIILLILAGAAVFSQKKADNIDTNREEVMEEAFQRPEITINAKHQYKNGQHNFIGTVELPTPCHQLDSEVIKGEEVTEIALTISNPDEDSGGVCAQVITDKNFQVIFDGEENENIIATLNGEAVNLNIFEVPEDQEMENVEIFLKG